MIRVHLHKSSKSFFRVFRGIQHIGTGFSHTGINPEISEFSDKWISHDLEGQCGKRFFIACMTERFIAILADTLDRRNIQRGWQVFDDRIQQQLNTFVFISRSA